MAQRMACIVLEEIRKEVGRPQLMALASTVQNSTPEHLPTSVEKCIDDMLNLGSRYINIEGAMGRGICLVLGCDLPESQYVIYVLPMSASPALIATAGISSCQRKDPYSIR